MSKLVLFSVAGALAATISLSGSHKGETPSAQPQVPMVRLRGVVVDASGNPVSGVVVGTNWTVSEGKAKPGPSVTTGAGGAFDGEFPAYYPIALAVLDQDRDLGGYAVVTEDKKGEEVHIVVSRLATLKWSLSFDAERPDWMGAYLMLRDNRPLMFTEDLFTGSLKVPAGEFTFSASSMVTNRVTVPVNAKPGQTTELGRLEFIVSGYAKNFGKPALPLTFSEARGVASDFKLSDLKGKWVLLEFWGYW